MRRWNVEFIVSAEVQVPDNFVDEDLIARCGAALINDCAARSAQSSPVVSIRNLHKLAPGSSYLAYGGEEELGDFRLFPPEELRKLT